MTRARLMVLGGTTEGREAAVRLLDDGFRVLFSATTDFAVAELREEAAARGLDAHLATRAGAVEAPGLAEAAKRGGASVVIDATHPFATRATVNAREAANALGLPYVRVTRRPTGRSGSDGVRRASSYEDAAATACALGRNILLTVGSRHLEPFVREADRRGCRVVARVLPEAQALEACRILGLKQSQIVAARGPFSVDFNIACMREFGAEVIVSKDSGATGGTDKKIEAAEKMRIPIVLIEAQVEADALIGYTSLRSRLEELGIKP